MVKDEDNPRKRPVRRALISVYDKAGLGDFAATLHAHGIEILSTGGTAKALTEHGYTVTDISDYTGFPEIMDGRIKTLHPVVHGGILARRNRDADMQAMQDHDILAIDMVVVNLYPFSQAMAEGADFDTCIENIDIGGPALIRAAAKNHADVTVITDPADYQAVKQELDEYGGATGYSLRKSLAATAYARTASYDATIAGWFDANRADDFPRRINFSGTWQENLRYGENPHQTAAVYRDGTQRPGALTAQQLQGGALSYNNLADADAAFELVAEFDAPAVAIVKHNNPCGVASAKTLARAYEKALACDPVSAFGGIIATNQPLDGEAAKEMIQVYSEVIIAPSISSEAMAVLGEKSKIRVLTTGDMPERASNELQVRSLAGGLLVQQRDFGRIREEKLNIVSEREPTKDELHDMLFAFSVIKHVKSNAIAYAKNTATVGIGAGQMSRVDACRIAARKAHEAAENAGFEESFAKGAVVASDAFFPFADGLIAAAEAGVTAVIQPGGSIRDEDIIREADDRGLAMAFTGMRHFRH